MEQHKQLISEIYDFVKSKNIKSFHCVAFGICDDITLIEIQDREKIIEPELHILLDPIKPSMRDDKFQLRQRFPLTKIFF